MRAPFPCKHIEILSMHACDVKADPNIVIDPNVEVDAKPFTLRDLPDGCGENHGDL